MDREPGNRFFVLKDPQTDVFQTWGIENVNDERRYARHVKFLGPKGEDIEARLIYDYRSLDSFSLSL